MSEYHFARDFPKIDPARQKQIPFFLTPEFVCRNGTHNVIGYTLGKNKKTIAFIFFDRSNPEEAISLPNSTFGGLALLDNIPNAAIVNFFQFIIKDLGECRIIIHQPPNIYPSHENIEEALYAVGFKTSCVEINQTIPINQYTFETKLNRNRKRILRQNTSLELNHLVLSIAQLPLAFSILKKNRASMQYPLTMTYNQLYTHFEQFPDRYFLFGIQKKDQLIAVSVCIRVTSEILYDFYHGELPEFRSFSPVTNLLKGIHDYAKSMNYKFIDLGISSVNGQLNKGLFQFKKSLGALETNKTTYVFEK